MSIATFASGCFWCTEAIFKRLKGVTSVTPGYTGGKTANPTYDDVCSGTTGHAESLQIEFDPQIIPYENLLEVFFATHDPTTLNQQGHDLGTQYRSAIFYHDDNQKQLAEQAVAQRNRSEALAKEGKKIVTEITPFTTFYVAEKHHQNYYDRNTDAPYCHLIIDPKITKLLHDYSDQVKDKYKTNR